jgi:drug/metabolite transporter (DMT)-like permease
MSLAHRRTLNTIIFTIRLPRDVAGRIWLSILVLILGTGFGLQYASARMMGLAGVEPAGALLLIHIGLSIIFLLVLALTRKLFRPTLLNVLFFTVIATYGNLGQLGIELAVAHHVEAGELTLIVSLLPVFVLLFAALFRTEALSLRKSFGMLLGVVASSAILLPEAAAAESYLFWRIAAFGAPASQAISMVLMGLCWPARLDPLQVATGNLVMGTLLLMPVTLLTGGLPKPEMLLTTGGLATALFGLTVAAEFYIVALLTRKGGAVMASCADFIAVCAGLGFGYMFFSEVPTLWMLAAAGLCMVALKLATDRAAPGI